MSAFSLQLLNKIMKHYSNKLNVLLPRLQDVINTISVDCFRPVTFSALNINTADALLHTFIISSDYQAHFTAVLDFATSLLSLDNHFGTLISVLGCFRLDCPT